MVVGPKAAGAAVGGQVEGEGSRATLHQEGEIFQMPGPSGGGGVWEEDGSPMNQGTALHLDPEWRVPLTEEVKAGTAHGDLAAKTAVTTPGEPPLLEENLDQRIDPKGVQQEKPILAEGREGTESEASLLGDQEERVAWKEKLLHPARVGTVGLDGSPSPFEAKDETVGSLHIPGLLPGGSQNESAQRGATSAQGVGA